MKCKYCHEEITSVRGNWKDGTRYKPYFCGFSPYPETEHAPEDSALALIARIDTLIAEAEDNFKEIKRLTAQLKEMK